MSNTEFKDLIIRILNKGWMHNNEPIDTTVLMDMAQNINSAAEVIKELKNEGVKEEKYEDSVERC